MALFNDAPPPSRRQSTIKAGYGTAKKARNTIRRLRHVSPGKARQVAQTMYFRAKYHKHRTSGMEQAMRIYQSYLAKIRHPQ